MVRLTLYGGVGQIGGNKMLLENGHIRLFFDFGTDYAQRYKYFEEYLNPRPGPASWAYIGAVVPDMGGKKARRGVCGL